MNLEDIEKIWNEQESKHMYVINEEVLYGRMRKETKNIRIGANITEWALFFIVIGLTVIELTKGFAIDELHRFAEVLIYLFVAGHILWTRNRRLKNELESDNTLLGNLEQAIRTLEHQIKRDQNFAWWFLAPFAVTMSLDMSSGSESMQWWKLLLGIGSLALALIVVKLGLRRSMIPRMKRLEAMRDLLLDSK